MKINRKPPAHFPSSRTETDRRAMARQCSETDRKLVEEGMKNTISLLQATLESCHDAILVVDLNKTWILLNQRFVDL